MEQYLCAFSSCKNPAKYICDCNLSIFCKNHLSKHKKISKKSHSIEPLFVLPSPNTKNVLLTETIYTQEQLKINNKNLIEKVSRIFFTLENLLEKSIIDTECDINKILRNITDSKKVCKLEKDPYLQLLNLDPPEALDGFRWWMQHEIEARTSKISQTMEEIIAHAEDLINDYYEFENTFWDSSTQSLPSKNISKKWNEEQELTLSEIIDEKIRYIDLEEQFEKFPDPGNIINTENLQNKPQSTEAPNEAAQCLECARWKTLDEYAIKCHGHNICNRCRIKNLTHCEFCNRCYMHEDRMTLEGIHHSLF